MAAPHRVLVLGATGLTGRQIVVQALEQGHDVTAASRHGAALDVSHARLTKANADVTTRPSPLPGLVAGHDVVISALGVGRRLQSRKLMQQAAAAIVEAMTSQRAKRLVFVSAFGVAGTAPNAPLVFRLMFRMMLASIYSDKAIAESAVKASGLEWTILAPVLLSNAAPSHRYRLQREITEGPWTIARADVAAAVLACIDDRATIGQRLVVGG